MVPADYAAASLQLTDAVLANLTARQLTDISLFGFGPDLNDDDDHNDHDHDADAARGRSDTAACKVFPGDDDYPSSASWAVLNLLTGGALIETVPIGAVCYPGGGAYDADKCADVLAHWTKSDIQ